MKLAHLLRKGSVWLMTLVLAVGALVGVSVAAAPSAHAGTHARGCYADLRNGGWGSNYGAYGYCDYPNRDVRLVVTCYNKSTGVAVARASHYSRKHPRSEFWLNCYSTEKATMAWMIERYNDQALVITRT